MLVYQCENCGVLTIGGYVNEFNQHFCKEKCYEEYCKKNNYEIHLNKLRCVHTALD